MCSAHRLMLINKVMKLHRNILNCFHSEHDWNANSYFPLQKAIALKIRNPEL